MQLLLILANNAAKIKYIITSARNAAATAKGMVELRSIVHSREEGGRLRQGRRGSRCSRIRDKWFEGLDNEDESPKVTLMLRVYPRLDYTQAPWTVVLR